MCEENNHEWVFQETQQKATTTCESGGYYKAHFQRRDCFYCKKCLEETFKEKKETVRLPFGGIHHAMDYAPIWYSNK